MVFELINATIVVAAQDHNPSILHPSFLAATGIVPASFELAGPSISTPAFSRVAYANGLVFQAEPDRLNVLEGTPPQDLSNSTIPVHAAAYVTTLPHVPYKAVGVNFTGVVLDNTPGASVIGQFLRVGPWNDANLPAQSVGLKFVYAADPGTLHLSIDPGETRRAQDGGVSPAIIVQANYHADVQAVEHRLSQTLQYIGLFGQRWSDYRAKLRRIFGDRA